jgi:hypothetical protein
MLLYVMELLAEALGGVGTGGGRAEECGGLSDCADCSICIAA